MLVCVFVCIFILQNVFSLFFYFFARHKSLDSLQNLVKSMSTFWWTNTTPCGLFILKFLTIQLLILLYEKLWNSTFLKQMQLNTSKKNEINNHPHLENIIFSQIERYYVNFYLILKVIVHLSNKIVKFLKVMDTSLQLELGVG